MLLLGWKLLAMDEPLLAIHQSYKHLPGISALTATPIILPNCRYSPSSRSGCASSPVTEQAALSHLVTTGPPWLTAAPHHQPGPMTGVFAGIPVQTRPVEASQCVQAHSKLFSHNPFHKECYWKSAELLWGIFQSLSSEMLWGCFFFFPFSVRHTAFS